MASRWQVGRWSLGLVKEASFSTLLHLQFTAQPPLALIFFQDIWGKVKMVWFYVLGKLPILKATHWSIASILLSHFFLILFKIPESHVHGQRQSLQPFCFQWNGMHESVTLLRAKGAKLVCSLQPKQAKSWSIKESFCNRLYNASHWIIIINMVRSGAKRNDRREEPW